MRKMKPEKVSNEETKSLEEKIFEAINNKDHTYRTARGIAHEVDSSEWKVAEVIYKSKDILKSRKLNQNKEHLFTTKEKINALPFSKKLLDVLSNSI
jgi:hypothetical protein